jgi:hypothetical protein
LRRVGLALAAQDGADAVDQEAQKLVAEFIAGK